jgi:hypothetical protein
VAPRETTPSNLNKEAFYSQHSNETVAESFWSIRASRDCEENIAGCPCEGGQGKGFVAVSIVQLSCFVSCQVFDISLFALLRIAGLSMLRERPEL